MRRYQKSGFRFRQIRQPRTGNKRRVPIIRAILVLLIVGSAIKIFGFFGQKGRIGIGLESKKVEAEEGVLKDGGAILAISRVGETSDLGLNISKAIPLDELKRQLEEFLDRGFDFVQVPVLVSRIDDESSGSLIALTIDGGYGDFYTELFPLLKELKLKATLYVISDFLDRSGYLTTDQLVEISNSDLVEIGSLTATHPDLRKVEKDRLETEVLGSKQKLESLIGRPVKAFAYPYGRSDSEITRAVKQAGYQTAVSQQAGSISKKSDPFLLPRIINAGRQTTLKVFGF